MAILEATELDQIQSIVQRARPPGVGARSRGTCTNRLTISRQRCKNAFLWRYATKGREHLSREAGGDQLKITLKADLAGMLSAAKDSKTSTDTNDLLVQIKLVAGAAAPPDLSL